MTQRGLGGGQAADFQMASTTAPTVGGLCELRAKIGAVGNAGQGSPSGSAQGTRRSGAAPPVGIRTHDPPFQRPYFCSLEPVLVPAVKPRLGAYPQWEILFNTPVWAGPAMFQFPCSMVISSSKIPGWLVLDPEMKNAIKS